MKLLVQYNPWKIYRHTGESRNPENPSTEHHTRGQEILDTGLRRYDGFPLGKPGLTPILNKGCKNPLPLKGRGLEPVLSVAGGVGVKSLQPAVLKFLGVTHQALGGVPHIVNLPLRHLPLDFPRHPGNERLVRHVLTGQHHRVGRD